MTKAQIDKLISAGQFPGQSEQSSLIETHISWVILCNQYVYKIKKPIQYTFLDFSTIEKRKYFCERELELNRRYTEDLYLGVLPVRETATQLFIGGQEGSIIDFAVSMRRLDTCRQMDQLLLKNQVAETDIRNLAETIAGFHKRTTIIYQKDLNDIPEKFNDLKTQEHYLSSRLGNDAGEIIRHAIAVSNAYTIQHRQLSASRLKAGFYRDCHGDLHSRNIFLLPAPTLFDCIEFNDDFRQIDVLNEIAFLCMDLDSFDRRDLSGSFLLYYNQRFPVIKTAEDLQLFIYYKSYRSNIRAKVNSLRAGSTNDENEKMKALAEASKYLQLMNGYIRMPELQL